MVIPCFGDECHGQIAGDERILETIVDRERVFDGIILHIDHLTAKLPNGKLAKREVALHVGASAVLPVDEEGYTYLVRQYRAPIERVLLEIPAGKLDSVDEDRLLAAKRELHEETGLMAEKLGTPGRHRHHAGLFQRKDLPLPGPGAANGARPRRTRTSF